jgi:hypothetical protein
MQITPSFEMAHLRDKTKELATAVEDRDSKIKLLDEEILKRKVVHMIPR